MNRHPSSHRSPRERSSGAELPNGAVRVGGDGMPAAKKSLGQHFLVDRTIIERIADAIPSSLETPDGSRASVRAIEIGPGTGALTRVLIRRFPELTVIEIDARMVDLLTREMLPENPGLTIHHQDVLKGSWDDWMIGGPIHLVGNLPYYATSPILFATLEHRDRLSGATFMIQKEVADRILAKPGSKEYGILSVQLQLMSTPRRLFDVKPGSFSPPPKVMSTVIRLDFDRPPLACSDEALKAVVRTAFQQRRKKLSNSLRPLLDPADYPGFDFTLRAEAWTPEMYERLAEAYEQDDKSSA